MGVLTVSEGCLESVWRVSWVRAPLHVFGLQIAKVRTCQDRMLLDPNFFGLLSTRCMEIFWNQLFLPQDNSSPNRFSKIFWNVSLFDQKRIRCLKTFLSNRDPIWFLPKNLFTPEFFWHKSWDQYFLDHFFLIQDNSYLSIFGIQYSLVPSFKPNFCTQHVLIRILLGIKSTFGSKFLLYLYIKIYRDLKSDQILLLHPKYFRGGIKIENRENRPRKYVISD